MATIQVKYTNGLNDSFHFAGEEMKSYKKLKEMLRETHINRLSTMFKWGDQDVLVNWSNVCFIKFFDDEE